MRRVTRRATGGALVLALGLIGWQAVGAALSSSPASSSSASPLSGLPLPPLPGTSTPPPVVASPVSGTAAPTHQVLTVAPAGTTYNGVPGEYSSIQAAVDAANPGDYILVAPGDYKTTSYEAPAGGPPAGVLITKPGLWLIGMDRNSVVVDGTKSGPPCSTAEADQNFGPDDSNGRPEGLNGIMVWKASDVWVENMTVCNFLGGSGGNGGTGNEVWWNNGANSGQMGPATGFWGNYLTATSTYFENEGNAAAYGIFSSNWNGGTFAHDYASNFNDSGFYIGACQDQCNQTVDNVWAENNALGYSGSNSGGTMLIENSEFDGNQDGFDTNSQNGDNPPPQDGACPAGQLPPTLTDPGTGKTFHPSTCWVFFHNSVHDNNTPNVPSAGLAGSGPVGTGMSLSGARDDTIVDNTFYDNNAWGTILVPFPDSGPPCSGGTVPETALPSQLSSLGLPCVFDEWGDAVVDNTYFDNGSWHNPTNGDIAAANLEVDPTDCFSGNTSGNGGVLKTSPPLAQVLYPRCTGVPVPPDLNPVFLDQVACDSQASIVSGVSGGQACLKGTSYPRQQRVIMKPLPGSDSLTDPMAAKAPSDDPIGQSALAGKKNPCAGVPANPWCPPPPQMVGVGTVVGVTGPGAGSPLPPLPALPQPLSTFDPKACTSAACKL